MKPQLKFERLSVNVLSGITAVIFALSINGLSAQEKNSGSANPAVPNDITSFDADQKPDRKMEKLQLSARVENETQKTFEPVRPIVLQIKMKNRTASTLNLEETMPYWDFGVIVKDKQGNTMPLTKFGADQLGFDTFSTKLLRLKPGEEKQYKLTINRLVYMTKTGVYFAKVHRKPLNRQHGQPTIISNTVKVIVAEIS